MKIKCIASFNATSIYNNKIQTYTDMLEHELIVLAVKAEPLKGIQVLIKTATDLVWTDLLGFECISNTVPKNWAFYNKGNVCWTMPESWNHDSFFEDLKNNESKAVRLYQDEYDLIVMYSNRSPLYNHQH